jgi:uncharacterized protein (DUF1778 family)
MARTPKAEADVKTYLVAARFTAAQRDAIRAAAAHENLDVSGWLRKIALDAAAAVNERAAKRAAKRSS